MARVYRYKNAPDFWVCLCGNRTLEEDFAPSNREGEEIPPKEDEDTVWFVCGRCGRIIDGQTLQVVGIRERG